MMHFDETVLEEKQKWSLEKLFQKSAANLQENTKADV